MSVVFGVAGWVTYLQKEKGALAGGGAGAETEDDEEGATLAQSDVDSCRGVGRPVTPTAPLCTTRRL